MAVINYLEDLNTMTANGSHTLARDLDFNDNASYSNVNNKTTWTTGNGWGYASANATFTGQVDGQGHSIKNLYINKGNGVDGGLFTIISGNSAVVKNLTLENPKSNGNQVGFVACDLGSGSTIDNIHVINGTMTVIAGASGCGGGLIAYLYGGAKINNCSFNGTITTPNMTASSTTNNIGGISASLAESGTANISRCKVSGTIAGAGGTYISAIGGILGMSLTGSSAPTLIIEDCYSEMVITAAASNAAYRSPIMGRRNTGTVTIRRCWTNKNVGNYTIIGNGTVTSQNNFFDRTTTGLSSSTGATAKTTAEMKTMSTFSGATWSIAAKAGFNPNGSTYWFIDGGVDYPRLWWEYVASAVAKRRRSSAVALLMN